jgi:hypothetical protein
MLNLKTVNLDSNARYLKVSDFADRASIETTLSEVLTFNPYTTTLDLSGLAGLQAEPTEFLPPEASVFLRILKNVIGHYVISAWAENDILFLIDQFVRFRKTTEEKVIITLYPGKTNLKIFVEMGPQADSFQKLITENFKAVTKLKHIGDEKLLKVMQNLKKFDHPDSTQLGFEFYYSIWRFSFKIPRGLR